jgi:hypothetical protein
MVANMGSFDDAGTIAKRHAEHMSHFEATEQDCKLLDLQPAPSWDKLKCHYKLEFYTYKGWKVYMLHTGCFASIPQYEDA